MSKPTILHADEGQILKASGTTTTFKLDSSLTGGRFSMAEYDLPAGFPGPPPHIHKKFEHAWYILKGTLQIQLQDDIYQLGEGAFVYVPCGVIHSFSNPNTEPTKLLAIDTPGGLEPYYEEIAHAFPDSAPINREVIGEIQSRYDTFPATNNTQVHE